MFQHDIVCCETVIASVVLSDLIVLGQLVLGRQLNTDKRALIVLGRQLNTDKRAIMATLSITINFQGLLKMGVCTNLICNRSVWKFTLH